MIARLLREIETETTDADLLGRFIDRRDEAAFAALVRRHGPMVYGVCRRILPTTQDAEDAFQATFLVLVEKAREIIPRGAVGNWLYGVARRAALLARRAIARRRERAGEMPERPAPDPLNDLRMVLDEELGRLPDSYRTVIVLCDLEGRTRREAAAILGWPEGTVAGRLTRARAVLAKRLARHAPVVSVAAVLAGTASARVPEVPAAFEAAMPPVAALTRGVLSAMFRGKLMKTATVVFLLGCAGFGMVLQAGQPEPPPKPEVALTATADEKPAAVKTAAVKTADDVVWGEEVDGLQLGLALAEPRAYKPGETVKTEVRLRNVGKARITITHGLLRESPPTVTDAAGKRVSISMPPYLGIYVAPTERVLKPGETISLYHPEVAVEALPPEPRPGPEPLVSTPTIRVRPAKYKLAFGGMVHSHRKLSTGTVEFEVREAEEAFAWGKAVDGLQAGIGPTRKAYRIGEAVTMVVKLRNVGKDPVTYTYLLTPFQYVVPTVHDSTGRPMTVDKQADVFYVAVPTKATLKPGEEVTLGPTGKTVELPPSKVPGWYPMFALASTSLDVPVARVTPGKYTVSYSGLLQSHPALATGFAEFEVMKGDLRGTWTIVSSTSGGKATDDRMTLTFDEDHMVITDGDNNTRGTYLVAPDKIPAPIDLVLRVGIRTTTIRGIYELSGDKLTICFGGPDADRPVAFSSKTGEPTTLSVFKRERK